MRPDRELDARDLLCPLPVLRVRKVLEEMQPGEVLQVIATDAMAAIDIPHFCVEAGHQHLGMTQDVDQQVHVIRRGPRRD
jgi:tRNA 2-thiouridine synthesizing protein A